MRNVYFPQSGQAARWPGGQARGAGMEGGVVETHVTIHPSHQRRERGEVLAYNTLSHVINCPIENTRPYKTHI
jgi:hypothetical protein